MKEGLPEIAWRREKLGYAAPTLDWTDQLFAMRAEELRMDQFPELLRPALMRGMIPRRLSFTVYNLLSTARVLNWSL
jgi:hypothetical protein